MILLVGLLFGFCFGAILVMLLNILITGRAIPKRTPDDAEDR